MARAKKNRTKDDMDGYIDICLKGANDLRKILNINDESHRLFHHRATSDARNYYIYEALNEIEKVGSSLMRAQGFLGEQDVKIDDRTSSNIIGAYDEELTLWIRKLVELLAEVILFSKINDDSYYRHYMQTKELKSLSDIIKGTKHAYGCHIQNYQKQVDELTEELSDLENNSIELNKCWYLAVNHGNRVSGTKGRLSGLEDRINAAFELATADQIVALGVSYSQGYDNLSGAMHFSAINRGTGDISVENLRSKAAGIGVIAANVIAQARRLLKDRRRKGIASTIAKAFSDGTEARRILQQNARPDIKVGDFVNAQGELAEVTKVMSGKYGFRSFRLKFLLKEDTEVAGSGESTTVWTHHNPDFEEYPAPWVRKLYGRKDILDRMRQEILKNDPNAKISTRSLTPHIRESIIHMWQNVGLKEQVRGRPDQAQQKIQQEIQRIKSKRDQSSN